ncbi:hypothetical protein ATO11_20125 [Pseudaestuariivita atlantica]|uniref:Uncharacterized protein n=1 Tax=Pseudaestuariivita atlantica TaxID=1317121 RepID=A0A0L1JJK7_9RHOB|nr:hypothetical protein ATO11_20125 [Pseudaestuariivita atlantica]
MLAASRRTGAIVKAMMATRAAMGQQCVTQGGTGAVKTNVQRSGFQPQVCRNHRAITVVDVNSADQFGITRTQFSDQPFDAVADHVHVFDRVIRDNSRLSFQCDSLLQTPGPSRLAIVIIQCRTQHRVQPGVHAVRLAQLILTCQNADAKFLQHVLSIGSVSQPFD